MCGTCIKDGIFPAYWAQAHESGEGRAKARAKTLKERIKTMEDVNRQAQGVGPRVDPQTIETLRQELLALAQVI